MTPVALSTHGAAIDPTSDDYIRQTVFDILTTPVGSRVMRRAYGSFLPELLDQPLNPATRIRLYGATALALLRWLKIARLLSVRLESLGGHQVLRLELQRTGLGSDQTPLVTTLPLRN